MGLREMFTVIVHTPPNAKSDEGSKYAKGSLTSIPKNLCFGSFTLRGTDWGTDSDSDPIPVVCS